MHQPFELQDNLMETQTENLPQCIEHVFCYFRIGLRPVMSAFSALFM